jgi:hypothetical protein
MVTDSAAEVDVENPVGPPYPAVIECIPTASELVAYVATPDPFSVPVPSVIVPSRNVTVPVGTAVPDAGVTVAVNVILVPLAAVVDEAVSAVLVPTGTVTAETTTVTAADVLPLKFESAPYTAVTLSEPTGSAVVAYVVTAEPFSVPVPRAVVPS